MQIRLRWAINGSESVLTTSLDYCAQFVMLRIEPILSVSFGCMRVNSPVGLYNEPVSSRIFNQDDSSCARV